MKKIFVSTLVSLVMAGSLASTAYADGVTATTASTSVKAQIAGQMQLVLGQVAGMLQSIRDQFVAESIQLSSDAVALNSVGASLQTISSADVTTDAGREKVSAQVKANADTVATITGHVNTIAMRRNAEVGILASLSDALRTLTGLVGSLIQS